MFNLSDSDVVFLGEACCADMLEELGSKINESVNQFRESFLRRAALGPAVPLPSTSSTAQGASPEDIGHQLLESVDRFREGFKRPTPASARPRRVNAVASSSRRGTSSKRQPKSKAGRSK